MNISSLQPLNTKYMRIAYAGIITSILLIASISLVAPSIASDDDVRTLRARGTHQGQTGSACVPGGRVDCPLIDRRFVLDDNLRVTTDILVYPMQGDLEGTAIGLFTNTRYVSEDRTFSAWYVALTYVGTMGDSDVGSFRMILSKICDGGRTPACQGQFTVAEGSGQEAFEGICGGGLYEFDSGEGTYDLVLRFGDDCDDFDWTEINDILANDSDSDSD